MTFLSIIVPFKKWKRFLKDCLDILAQQNLEDSEVILIVNGAEENLDDLLEEYKNVLNLVVEEFRDELGAREARNIALNKASGKYLYFLDSDNPINLPSLNQEKEKKLFWFTQCVKIK